MEADAWVFLSGSLLHIVLTSSLMIYFRLRVSAQVLAVGKAKTAYTWLCLLLGICVGIGSVSMLDVLDVPTSHGEIIVAILLANLVLAGMLIVAGRIVIGWVPMRW